MWWLPAAVARDTFMPPAATEIASKVARMTIDTGCEDILVTSSLKKTGFEEVEEFIFQSFIKVGET